MSDHDERLLPKDLFGRVLAGEIDHEKARELAIARWERDERRGYTANDLVRQRVFGQRDDQRERWPAVAGQQRDPAGRFARGNERPDMNEMMREAARGMPPAQGTIITPLIESMREDDETGTAANPSDELRAAALAALRSK